jgi:hypothetical protein
MSGFYSDRHGAQLGLTDVQKVDKAKAACKNTGLPVADHFVDATEMVECPIPGS